VTEVIEVTKARKAAEVTDAIEAAETRKNRPILEFEDLSFAYESRPVLEGVNLFVGPREFASIVGPNGGGKTTLLKLALGLLTPSRGRVLLFGASPEEGRHRVGYTPQHALFDRAFPISVLEVVLTGRLRGRAWGGYTGEDLQAARKALEQVRLYDLERRPFQALSGGQRQRVLIARALCGNPELLLLDEPTANVDPDTGEQILYILQELNESMAILLVSHDVGFVSSVVRSVICVNRQVVMHPTHELSGAHLQDLYGENYRVVRHDKHHGSSLSSVCCFSGEEPRV